jgi:peptidoglycan/xylan/chitin deacetylase (PgdA/CDA1 family)
MLLRNFLFHRVSDDKDALWPPMTPVLFDKIIGKLVKKYEIVNLENFLGQKISGPLRKPVATILFDDGYKDNIEYAAPVLKKNNCLASFYVVTDCINRNIPTWTYLVDHILQQTKTSTINLYLDNIPEELKQVEVADKTKISRIKPWMKKLSNSSRVVIVNSILNQCQDVQLPENKMMNWEDLRQLKEAGFTIGSHSHTHPMLAALESEKEIEEELSVSAGIIRDKLGERPLTISYPIGSFDERVIRLSLETGYHWGLGVEQRVYRHGQDPLMAIPRIELYQEPWWKVRLRTNNLFQQVKRAWL